MSSNLETWARSKISGTINQSVSLALKAAVKTISTIVGNQNFEVQKLVFDMWLLSIRAQKNERYLEDVSLALKETISMRRERDTAIMELIETFADRLSNMVVARAFWCWSQGLGGEVRDYALRHRVSSMWHRRDCRQLSGLIIVSWARVAILKQVEERHQQLMAQHLFEAATKRTLGTVFAKWAGIAWEMSHVLQLAQASSRERMMNMISKVVEPWFASFSRQILSQIVLSWRQWSVYRDSAREVVAACQAMTRRMTTKAVQHASSHVFLVWAIACSRRREYKSHQSSILSSFVRCHKRVVLTRALCTWRNLAPMKQGSSRDQSPEGLRVMSTKFKCLRFDRQLFFVVQWVDDAMLSIVLNSWWKVSYSTGQDLVGRGDDRMLTAVSRGHERLTVRHVFLLWSRTVGEKRRLRLCQLTRKTQWQDGHRRRALATKVLCWWWKCAGERRQERRLLSATAAAAVTRQASAPQKSSMSTFASTKILPQSKGTGRGAGSTINRNNSPGNRDSNPRNRNKELIANIHPKVWTLLEDLIRSREQFLLHGMFVCWRRLVALSLQEYHSMRVAKWCDETDEAMQKMRFRAAAVLRLRAIRSRMYRCFLAWASFDLTHLMGSYSSQGASTSNAEYKQTTSAVSQQKIFQKKRTPHECRSVRERSPGQESISNTVERLLRAHRIGMQWISNRRDLESYLVQWRFVVVSQKKSEGLLYLETEMNRLRLQIKEQDCMLSAVYTYQDQSSNPLSSSERGREISQSTPQVASRGTPAQKPVVASSFEQPSRPVVSQSPASTPSVPNHGSPQPNPVLVSSAKQAPHPLMSHSSKKVFTEDRAHAEVVGASGHGSHLKGRDGGRMITPSFGDFPVEHFNSAQQVEKQRSVSPFHQINPPVQRPSNGSDTNQLERMGRSISPSQMPLTVQRPSNGSDTNQLERMGRSISPSQMEQRRSPSPTFHRIYPQVQFPSNASDANQLERIGRSMSPSTQLRDARHNSPPRQSGAQGRGTVGQGQGIVDGVIRNGSKQKQRVPNPVYMTANPSTTTVKSRHVLRRPCSTPEIPRHL